MIKSISIPSKKVNSDLTSLKTNEPDGLILSPRRNSLMNGSTLNDEVTKAVLKNFDENFDNIMNGLEESVKRINSLGVKQASLSSHYRKSDSVLNTNGSKVFNKLYYKSTDPPESKQGLYASKFKATSKPNINKMFAVDDNADDQDQDFQPKSISMKNIENEANFINYKSLFSSDKERDSNDSSSSEDNRKNIVIMSKVSLNFESINRLYEVKETSSDKNVSNIMKDSSRSLDSGDLNKTAGPVEELEKHITSIGPSAKSIMRIDEIVNDSDADSLNYSAFTNTQEILDFHEYTKECLSKIQTMPDISYIPNQYSVPYELNKKQYKKLAVFDLDETLIHCTKKDYKNSDVILKINLPKNITTKVGINIRPGIKESLRQIQSYKYDIICYTASIKNYADAVLDFIDPDKDIFSLRLYRTDCFQTKIDEEMAYIKDLRIFKNISPKDIIIIDNSILSFALHLDNGIPILPYYTNKMDTELIKLADYLKVLVDYEDIRAINRQYIKYNSDIYENSLIHENESSSSFYDQSESGSEVLESPKFKA